MAGSDLRVNGLFGSKITIPVGATAALCIGSTGGQMANILKYFSGGSLEIINCPPGATLTGAQLIAAQGTGYLFGSNEAVSWDGPARFYLMATGATVIAYGLGGLSAGF
jgi:hypothetical protein